MLKRFVVEGVSPEIMRDERREWQDAGNRRSSITRGPVLAAVSEIRWSFHISDIQSDTPERYCAGVREWAQAILTDSAQLAAILSGR